MFLKEALQLLKDGAQLYRTGWLVKDGYIVLMPGITHVWKVVIQPQPNAGNFMWSYEDLIGGDWEVFTMAKPEEVKLDLCQEPDAA